MRGRPLTAVAVRFRAFSLVEVLVVIGIVGVLVGLTAPALFAARARARGTVGLVNLRDIGPVLAFYHAANREYFPFAKALTPLPWGSLDQPVHTTASDSPWILSTLWPTLMHGVAPWHEHYASWRGPCAPKSDHPPWLLPDGVGDAIVPYHLVRSVLARPEAWTITPPPAGTELRAATRSFEILFPSSKAIVFDEDRLCLRRPATPADTRGVLSADGAAAPRLDLHATAGVPNFVGAVAPVPYHDTPQGVRGRDY